MLGSCVLDNSNNLCVSSKLSNVIQINVKENMCLVVVLDENLKY